MYNCINCKWKGDLFDLSKVPQSRLAGKCPVCGDEVVKRNINITPNLDLSLDPKFKVNLDLDKDGDVDKDDASIAGKVLSKFNKRSRSKKRGKKR